MDEFMLFVWKTGYNLISNAIARATELKKAIVIYHMKR